MTAPTWDDTVERLRSLREVDDVSRWTAGDVVVGYLGDVERSTLGEVLDSLAAQSGYTRAGLRERYDCSKFWRPETRRWNTVVSWSHYNRARRGFEFEDACDLMERAEQQAMSVAEFERHCQSLKGNGAEYTPAQGRAFLAAGWKRAAKKYREAAGLLVADRRRERA